MSARIFLSSLFQGSFPGNLHLVLVLRPSTFFQRTLSEVFFKVNKDEFKMKVHILGFFFIIIIIVVIHFGIKKNIYHQYNISCFCSCHCHFTTAAYEFTSQ